MVKLAFLRIDLLLPCPHLEIFYLLMQLVFFHLLQLPDQIHNVPMIKRHPGCSFQSLVTIKCDIPWNLPNPPHLIFMAPLPIQILQILRPLLSSPDSPPKSPRNSPEQSPSSHRSFFSPTRVSVTSSATSLASSNTVVVATRLIFPLSIIHK